MKSLHIITALNFGGAEAMLAKLLNQQRSMPVPDDCLVVSLINPGVVGEQMIGCGVAVEALDLRHPGNLPRAAAQLRRIVRRFGPDVIQGWMYHGNLAASLAAKMAPGRPPLLWNIRHSLSRPDAEHLRSRAIIRLGALLSHAPRVTIYNSAASRKEHAAYGYCAERTIVIPNGFDCRGYSPRQRNPGSRERLVERFGIDDKAIVIAMIARSHPMKDHATVIEAAGRARRMGHDIHLLLTGAGTERLSPSLMAACAEWLPANRLTLAGDRRDVPDWLAGCDIVALSSAWGEGFPNILGEAMASGVPCIATDVGDSRSIIGEGGICVPPGEPETMARAIATLCEVGSAARQEIGLRGRQRVLTHYSLPAITERYARLYETVLQTPLDQPFVQGASQCAG